MEAKKGSKVDRYNWANPAQQGKYRDLPIDSLVVDLVYQRSEKDINELNIRRIAREFDWMAFGTIIVAERDDGLFYVVDGQHRVEALRRRQDIDSVPSMVYPSIGSAQEALSFLRTSTGRTPLKALSRWRVRLASGLSPESEIAPWLHENGLRVAKNGTRNGIDFPTCLCRTWSRDKSSCKLALLTQVAITDGEGMTSDIHKGLSQLEHYGIETMPHAPKIRLLGGRSVLIQSINRYGIEAGSDWQSERLCAVAILAVINKGKRNKLTIPDRPGSGRRPAKEA